MTRSRSVRRALPTLALFFVLPLGEAGGASPRIHYIVHCQGCHLADGEATPGKVPALRGSMERFLEVPGGREFLVRVPGTAQAPLSDAQIADLLNWMLVEFGPGDATRRFEPYTAEEVHRYRRVPLTDVGGTRRRLLERRDPPR